MPTKEIIEIVKEVGLPIVIIFWLLFINGKHQERTLKSLNGIYKAITSLTVCIHETAIYVKGKGGADFEH